MDGFSSETVVYVDEIIINWSARYSEERLGCLCARSKLERGGKKIRGAEEGTKRDTYLDQRDPSPIIFLSHSPRLPLSLDPAVCHSPRGKDDRQPKEEGSSEAATREDPGSDSGARGLPQASSRCFLALVILFLQFFFYFIHFACHRSLDY